MLRTSDFSQDESNLTKEETQTMESLLLSIDLAWDIRFSDPKRAFELATIALDRLNESLSTPEQVVASVPELSYPDAHRHLTSKLAWALLCISYCYKRFSDFTQSHTYAEKARTYFESILQREQCIDADILIAQSLEKKGDYSQAGSILSFARTSAQLLGYIEGEANAELGLGYVEYSMGNYKAALEFFLTALSLFENAEIEYGVGFSELGIGNVSFHRAEYTDALQRYNRASEIFFRLQDLSGQANALTNIGFIHHNLGDFAGANEFLHQALSLRKLCDDKNGEAIALHGIGIVQAGLGEHVLALENFKKGLILRRNTGDLRGEAEALHAVGNQYFMLKQYDEALSYLSRSLEIQQKIQDRWGEASSLTDLGQVCEVLEHYDKAIEFYERALSIREKMEDKVVIASSYQKLASVYSKTNAIEEALEYAKKALRMAEEMRARAEMYHAHLVLSEVYERAQRVEEAFLHYKLYQKLKEQVFSEESTKRLKSIEVVYQLEQARKEAELRKAEADIYRLKHMEMSAANEALIEANAMKTKLLGVAANDLKYPLGSISNFAKLLIERHQLSSPQDRQYLNIILDLSNRMVSLINDLLSNAALESGAISLKKRPINLGKLIEVISVTHHEWARRKSQTVRYDLEENCTVYGDEERLREIINNLVLNAVKFSPKETTILIRLAHSPQQPAASQTAKMPLRDDEPQRVRLSIKDEGQGILEEEFTMLFQRFSKLSATPTDGESTTGLGLSIVKELIELHDGKVWAESAGRDKGATFLIELPSYRL